MFRGYFFTLGRVSCLIFAAGTRVNISWETCFCVFFVSVLTHYTWVQNGSVVASKSNWFRPAKCQYEFVWHWYVFAFCNGSNHSQSVFCSFWRRFHHSPGVQGTTFVPFSSINTFKSQLSLINEMMALMWIYSFQLKKEKMQLLHWPFKPFSVHFT